MAVELFSAAQTRPGAIFCDTSFILDLLTHDMAAVAANIRDLTADKQARAAQVAQFFYAYSTVGTRFVSSPYTIQEVFNVLLKNILKSNSKAKQWKDLAQSDYPTFLALRASALRTIQDVWSRVQQHSIACVVPASGDELIRHGTKVDQIVVETALSLLKVYGRLDPMDAFHITMGTACGLEWFATTDAHWKTVAEINVFCDS